MHGLVPLNPERNWLWDIGQGYMALCQFSGANTTSSVRKRKFVEAQMVNSGRGQLGMPIWSWHAAAVS